MLTPGAPRPVAYLALANQAITQELILHPGASPAPLTWPLKMFSLTPGWGFSCFEVLLSAVHVGSTSLHHHEVAVNWLFCVRGQFTRIQGWFLTGVHVSL